MAWLHNIPVPFPVVFTTKNSSPVAACLEILQALLSQLPYMGRAHELLQTFRKACCGHAEPNAANEEVCSGSSLLVLEQCPPTRVSPKLDGRSVGGQNGGWGGGVSE